MVPGRCRALPHSRLAECRRSWRRVAFGSKSHEYTMRSERSGRHGSSSTNWQRRARRPAVLAPGGHLLTTRRTSARPAGLPASSYGHLLPSYSTWFKDTAAWPARLRNYGSRNRDGHPHSTASSQRSTTVGCQSMAVLIKILLQACLKYECRARCATRSRAWHAPAWPPLGRTGQAPVRGSGRAGGRGCC